MKPTDLFKKYGLNIQDTSYTCGPCTLLNILQLKDNISYTEQELAKLCETKPGVGTTNEAMVKVARQVGLEVVEDKQNASIKDIEQHLDDGNTVVICYQHAYSGEGHYGLITEHDEKAFYFRDCSAGFFRLRKKYLTKFWYGSDGVKQWFMAIE